MISSALLLVVVLSAECPKELFRIERSKNANVVVYEGNAGSQTPIDTDHPVSASWLLLASTGKRAGLNFLEKLLAYGFEARSVEKGQRATLTLKALRGRPLKVVQRDGCLAAIGSIDGAQAVLKRVFVTTDERGATPKVTGIELFGVDAVTGAERTEKLIAGK